MCLNRERALAQLAKNFNQLKKEIQKKLLTFSQNYGIIIIVKKGSVQND